MYKKKTPIKCLTSAVLMAFLLGTAAFGNGVLEVRADGNGSTSAATDVSTTEGDKSEGDTTKSEKGWKKSGNKWWYDNGDGTYAKSEYVDGYWLDQNGWYNSAWDGSWHKNKTGWWFQSGSWYPAGSWLKINGSWYYFGRDGYMKSSEWVRDGGNRYYLTESGAMAVSTTIDGFKINENGQRILTKSVEEMISESDTAKKTSQIVLVVDHDLTLWQKQSDGTWKSSKTMYCGYGKNGFSDPEKRVKGDRKTQLGSYELNYAFGISDNPGTYMTYQSFSYCSTIFLRVSSILSRNECG